MKQNDYKELQQKAADCFCDSSMPVLFAITLAAFSFIAAVGFFIGYFFYRIFV